MTHAKLEKLNIMLTENQLKELMAFASDDRQSPSMEALESLNTLYFAVQRNLLKNHTGLRKRNIALNEKVQKLVDRQHDKILAGEFAETGLDSVEVALGLLYQLQQLNTYKLNKYKLNAILYEMYASWLQSKNERLFIEHPVATKFGPQFWRVFKRIETSTPVQRQAWLDLAGKNPAVAAFCKNAAAKYYDYTEGDITRPFLKSKPYKNADDSHNGGKWNKEISDQEIYAWKQEQKNK